MSGWSTAYSTFGFCLLTSLGREKMAITSVGTSKGTCAGCIDSRGKLLESVITRVGVVPFGL